MKNKIVLRRNVEVNEKEVEVLIVINKEAFEKAVKSNWDSFVFADNDTEIAYLKIGAYVYPLYVTGDILIKDLINNKEYTNKDSKLLEKLALSKELYDESKFEIINNNWFNILISCEAKIQEDGAMLYHSYEDIVFEETPTTIEELAEILISKTVSSMTDEEISEQSIAGDITFKRLISNGNKNVEAIITVYKRETDLAILSNWDSLVFADNETWFANITVDNRSMDLGTSGTVTITNNDGDILFVNKDWKELGDLILKEGYLNEEQYNISDNNWFSLLLSSGELTENGDIEYRTYDDVVFEDKPTSISELVNLLAQYAENVLINENNN